MNVNKQRQKRNDFRMNRGLDAQDGPMILEVRPLDSTNEADWVSVAAVGSEPAFSGGLKFTDIVTGFEEITMDKTFKGRKPTLTMSLMAPDGQALKMAFGTDSYSLVQPAVPIASTIDDAVPPTFLTNTLTAVTGFQVGQRIAVMTGGTNNPEYELRHIFKINAGTKLVTFDQPLDRLPVDGAAIFVVESENIDVGSGLCEDQQVRVVQILGDESEVFLTLKRATVDKDGSFKGGMDGAKMFDVSFEALAAIEEDASMNLVTSYFTWKRLYKTDFS